MKAISLTKVLNLASKVVLKPVFITWLALLSFSSCEEFVKIDPPKTQLPGSVAFEDDLTATSTLLGIYSAMQESPAGSFATYSVNLASGLAADELIDLSGYDTQGEFYSNSITVTNANVAGIWNEAFQYIYVSNAIIEGVAKSTGITPTVRKQLEGEARFIRAFCHFYLTNLFGDVPYIKTSDYHDNAIVGRLQQVQVYQEIIADLLSAQTLLTDAYPTKEKVRPNKATATALLARVYLYNQDWTNAAAQASAVISSGTYSLPVNPASVFLKNSTEAIWQLMPIPSANYTWEGDNFSVGYEIVSDSLLNAFEAGDLRRTNWIDSITYDDQTYYSFPSKYKAIYSATTLTEYYMMFRLAEQYLIRAEALAHQNDIVNAVGDLNIIRTRAGLTGLSTTISQAQCLAAVAHERRIEFFCEWGHRWLDLKRTGKADAVLSVTKSAWQSTDALFPIPQTQMLNDPNMVQNPGY